MQAVTKRRVVVDEEQRQRAELYRVLGALLASSPDAAALDTLRQWEVDADASPLAQSLAELVSLAAQSDTQELAAVFTELFIGMGRGELVPFGSWYASGFLMDKPLARLRQDLQQLGFAREEGVTEPEDHAAALCDVMQQLIDGEEPAELDVQRRFFVNHLLPWLPRFFADLQRAESADAFYRAVGRFGEQLIKEEKQYLVSVS
ncbi:MAG: hypothetical protein Kow006_08260 [Gammaproteobacteria bacterium]